MIRWEPGKSYWLRMGMTILAMTATMFERELVAQSSSSAAMIQVSGSHGVLLKPEKLRLQMVVRAEGTDAKQAIKQLAQHKERVRKELLELKAEEASIEFGAPRFTPTTLGMSDAMSSGQLRRYLRNMDMDAKKLEGLPTIYNVVATLKVDWVLPTANVDAIALLPEGLKEQVMQRDLVGAKNKSAIDAAMQERLDEIKTLMTDQLGMDVDDASSAPIRIVFVAKLTPSQRQENLKKALEAAQQEASEIALASGVTLGPLERIASRPTAPGLDWAARARQMNGWFGGMEDTELPYAPAEASDEVTAESPDELRSTSTLTVIYATR